MNKQNLDHINIKCFYHRLLMKPSVRLVCYSLSLWKRYFPVWIYDSRLCVSDAQISKVATWYLIIFKTLSVQMPALTKYSFEPSTLILEFITVDLCLDVIWLSRLKSMLTIGQYPTLQISIVISIQIFLALW